MDTLQEVTSVSPATTTMPAEEKYKVQAPEMMQETFMTDSEDEGGERYVPFLLVILTSIHAAAFSFLVISISIAFEGEHFNVDFMKYYRKGRFDGELKC